MGTPKPVGTSKQKNKTSKKAGGAFPPPSIRSKAISRPPQGDRSAAVGRSEGRTGFTLLWIAAVLAPALISLVVVFSQMDAFPYQDDYHAILAFAVRFHEIHGVAARCLYVVAAQHNEYKLIFEHAIVAAELALTHRVNFSFLAALGNLSVLPIGYMLWRGYPIENGGLDAKLREFIPVSLLFFTAGYWETMNWPMGGLQNITVVMFSLLALSWLTSDVGNADARRTMALACVAAFLAVCSSPNGFLLAPVGSVFLASRRAYRRLLLWNGLFALPLAMYVYQYHWTSHDTYSNIAGAVMFFMDFVGLALPLPGGAAIVLAIAAVAIFARFDRISPAYFYSAMWVFATALLVAVMRGGAGNGVGSRYSIYSQLLLVFCYAFLMAWWKREYSAIPRKSLACVAAGCLILFLLGDWHAYQSLGSRRRMIAAGIDYYEADPRANSPMIDPSMNALLPTERLAELREINEAVAQGIYAPPTAADGGIK
jgi:hypothetical protein